MADVIMVETTAKTMAATLALLAMHPEEQDIVADEIQRVLVNGRDAVCTVYAIPSFTL